jgi:hypothetical protein
MENSIQPIIGQKIYVPSSIYVYRGADDFAGGLATIDKIEHSKHLPKDHFNYTMVVIKERPNTSYNWNILLEKQESLKKDYAGKIAHHDPDLRPDFNDDNADWKICK